MSASSSSTPASTVDKAPCKHETHRWCHRLRSMIPYATPQPCKKANCSFAHTLPYPSDKSKIVAKDVVKADMPDYTIRTVLTDLHIHCPDDVDLYYSKYVLCTHSSVIRTAFKGDPAGGKFDIEGHDSHIVTALLYFLDHGIVIDMSVSDYNSLHTLAHGWDILKLENIIGLKLSHTPTWTILEDLERKHSKYYPDAVRCIIDQDIETCAYPKIVKDLVKAFRDKLDKLEKSKRYY
jgi:hypothetical protein